MYFNPSLPHSKIGAAVMKAVALGGVQSWQGRVSKLTDETRRNPFAPYYFAERYEYELAMAEVCKFKSATGRVPDVGSADAKTMRLYSFVAMLSGVYDRLAPQAQKSLVGRIQSGLRDDVGISPLAYELTMASHLMQKGVDVEWRDWEAGGYDFLVRNGSVEAEVECKTFSADIGRKVHRRHHFQLGGRIHEEIGRALDRDDSIFVDTLI